MRRDDRAEAHQQHAPSRRLGGAHTAYQVVLVAQRCVRREERADGGEAHRVLPVEGLEEGRASKLQVFDGGHERHHGMLGAEE